MTREKERRDREKKEKAKRKREKKGKEKRKGRFLLKMRKLAECWLFLD